MYISDSTLDDLLYRVLKRLVTRKREYIETSRGRVIADITGVLLQLTNPRARLSQTEKKGKIFSSLGELFWYLAGSNDVRFISHYVRRYEDETEDEKTIYGAYGPRLFSMARGKDRVNQVTNVIELLRKKSTSRRAVIQLFDAADLQGQRRSEIPCTCSLQFIVRQGRLNMFTSMRSNDAFLGLQHDVFAFTMLQELIARSLDLEVGKYKHFAGSLHLYEKNEEDALAYLREGFQQKSAMPPMPVGDPWPSVKKVISAEKIIRAGKPVDARKLGLEAYWGDLVRLLQVYKASQANDGKRIGQLRKQMSTADYDIYIEQKRRSAIKKANKPEQLTLLDF